MYKYLWRKFYDSGSDGEINASTILMTNFLLLLFQFVKSWQKVVGGWREVGFLTLNVGLWWLKLCYYVSWQEMRLKYLIFFQPGHVIGFKNSAQNLIPIIRDHLLFRCNWVVKNWNNISRKKIAVQVSMKCISSTEVWETVKRL